MCDCSKKCLIQMNFDFFLQLIKAVHMVLSGMSTLGSIPTLVASLTKYTICIQLSILSYQFIVVSSNKNSNMYS